MDNNTTARNNHQHSTTSSFRMLTEFRRRPRQPMNPCPLRTLRPALTNHQATGYANPSPEKRQLK
jgi:hypothetical protein